MRRLVTAAIALAALFSVFTFSAPASAAEPTVIEGTYSGEQLGQVVDNLFTAATIGSVACGITDLSKKAKSLRKKGGLASVAALSAQISAKQSGIGKTCKLAKEIAKAGVYAAVLGANGDPVFVSEHRSVSTGWISKTYTYTYYVGRSPADAVKFGPGTVKNARLP